MVNPARRFLLCSCTPLSEALSAPCEEQPFGLISSRTTTISPGGQRSKRPRPALLWAFPDSSPSSPTSSSCPCSPPLLAPTLRPDNALPLICLCHRYAHPHSLARPLQHPLICLLPLIWFWVFFFLFPAHSAWLDLQLSRLSARLLSITALPFAISHLILLPTCSSFY